MISDEERSKVLLEALPYIKKYSGKIIVVKYGGNAMVNETLMNNVIDDIILLKYFGVKVILVHGGGPEITSLLSKVGKKNGIFRRNEGIRR
jgi:acetylglutamate kinase